MNAEEKVKSIYPDASCNPDIWGIQWEVTTGSTKYHRYFGSLSESEILSTSNISIEEAWEYAWISIQEKMIKKLES